MIHESMVLLRGGTVYDGAGEPPVAADVLVSGDRIAAVGPDLSAPTGAEVIDVSGLDVLPGFVDVHTHDDAALFRPGGCEPKIRQGVTTAVIGNCGHGCAPSIDGDALVDYSTPVLGPFPDTRWETFEQYLKDLGRKARTVNVMALVPHAPLRASVMGMDRRSAEEPELAAMCEALTRALEAGATGLSFGVMYSPGNSATPAELTALAGVVAEHRGIIVAHVRNEANLILEAIDEIARLGAETGAAIHISHLKVTGPANVGRMPEVLNHLERHRSRGVDITTDLYPYEAGSTTVATVFPPWTADRGSVSLLAALADTRARARIVTELNQPWPDVPIENYYASIGPENILLAGFSLPAFAGYDGHSLAAIAQERGQDPAECLIDLTLAEKGKLSVVLFQTDLEGMKRALAWPWTYVGSDGLPSEFGYVHPRLYGTFSRVLSQYAGPGSLLSRSEAIRRMTGAPAARFGLGERGLIRKGMYADLVVVEPGGPFDRATYAAPRREPEGIHMVFINGTPSWSPDMGSSRSFGRLISAQPVGATL